MNGVTFDAGGTSVHATVFAFTDDSTATAQVPVGAVTGRLLVTTPVNDTASVTNFSVAPAAAASLTSFLPASGTVGATVVITGTNFCGTTGVTFDTTAATTFTVDSATQIASATVPTGATTGPVHITTPSGTADSATNFTVTGEPDDHLLLSDEWTGRNERGHHGNEPHRGDLGDVQHDRRDELRRRLGDPDHRDRTDIGADPDHDCEWDRDQCDQLHRDRDRDRRRGMLHRSDLSPAGGPVGTSVVITGTNFADATSVTFNNVLATTFTVNSASQITATVLGARRPADHGHDRVGPRLAPPISR
jgi:hypothetical protein